MIQNCHIEINRMFEEAMSLEDNPRETAIKVLHVAARTLGSQIARLVDSTDEVPKLLAETVESLGQGISAGMMLHHGQHGEMSIQMYKAVESR